VLVGSDPVTTTIAANRDYAVPVYSALNADRRFRAVSNGFAGKASDGLTQLDASRALRARAKTPTAATSCRPRRSTSAGGAISSSR
jgi:Glucodextranase, domain N